MKKFKLTLLPKIFIAIFLGLLFGQFLPTPAVRIFVTFNGLFAGFLGFCIPLIILGLVAPGIADLGKSAGRLLFITAAIAYCSTILSGFFTYFSCEAVFPFLLKGTRLVSDVQNPEESLLAPFFTIDMPPVFGVMTALVLAFILGIGISAVGGKGIKSALNEFKGVIEWLITAAIIPLLPLYIFGIFLNMSSSGTAFTVIGIFGKIIIVIFILQALFLLFQFTVAGGFTKQNPIRLLVNMLPAYITALGTSSSAATIPITLNQTKKNGVDDDIADFCIPLCATIHLSGSTMKIVATSLAICMLKDMPHDIGLFAGFILMLGVMMIAAPGVPGGAIMAATGLLQSMLGFDNESVGLMIALYIAIDSFGTACNVTGDGAIAVIVNKIAKKSKA